MPNVIVTCVFNPPTISIQGANLRQDTIDALQRTLPKQTTTSLPTQRTVEEAKFLLTDGQNNAAPAAMIEGQAGAESEGAEYPNEATNAAEAEGSTYTKWSINLGQHYCCQKGRSMICLTIMEALEEEGYALRGTHSLVNEQEKDVTRLIFARN